MNQLELHKKITEFLKAGVAVANVKTAQDLLVNEDAKRFFFTQADETWLDWLWMRGFLNEIKKKVDHLNQIKSTSDNYFSINYGH